MAPDAHTEEKRHNHFGQHPAVQHPSCIFCSKHRFNASNFTYTMCAKRLENLLVYFKWSSGSNLDKRTMARPLNDFCFLYYSSGMEDGRQAYIYTLQYQVIHYPPCAESLYTRKRQWINTILF